MRLTVLPLLLAVVLSACVTPSNGTAPPTFWSEDEAQIRTATQRAVDAWSRGDLRGHLAMYADSATYMTGSGPRPGVDAIERSFERAFFVGDQPKQQLRFEEVAVRRLGADAALGRGRYVLYGGSEVERSGWFTLVWARTSEGWRVVRDHSG